MARKTGRSNTFFKSIFPITLIVNDIAKLIKLIDRPKRRILPIVAQVSLSNDDLNVAKIKAESAIDKAIATSAMGKIITVFIETFFRESISLAIPIETTANIAAMRIAVSA